MPSPGRGRGAGLADGMTASFLGHYSGSSEGARGEGHATAGVQAKAIGVDGCEDSRNAGGMNPRAAEEGRARLPGEKSTEPPDALRMAPDRPHPSHPRLVHCTVFKHVPKASFSLAGFLIFLCLFKKGAGGGCGFAAVGGLPSPTPSSGCKVAVTASRIWSFQFKDRFRGRRGQEACKWPPAQQAPGPAASEVPGLPTSEGGLGGKGGRPAPHRRLERPVSSTSPPLPGLDGAEDPQAGGGPQVPPPSLPSSVLRGGPRVKALFLGLPGSRTAPEGSRPPGPRGGRVRMRREGAMTHRLKPNTRRLPSPSRSPSSGGAAAATPKRMKGRPRPDRERVPAAPGAERSRWLGPWARRAAAAAGARARRAARRPEQEAAAAAEGPGPR